MKLVEHNADVNCAFPNGENAGETPIISAARLNQIDLAKTLIEKKANISACTKSGKTTFYYATLQCNIELLKILINASSDKDSDLNRRYEENKPLTHILLQRNVGRNALTFLEELYNNGLRVDLTDALGETPLHIAARNKENKEIVTWLIHKGCDPQQMNITERTVFSVSHKSLVPVIIQAYSEEESLKAIEESHQFKIQLEEEEMVNRIENREKLRASKSPSETNERTIDSKRKTKLLAMTKRGGTLRTPTQSKSSKFTPIKKTEARPWGGSKQTAKFQRDTRLKIRQVKKDILDQIEHLKEEIQEIKKKIDIDAGIYSESVHSNEDNYEEENENELDSYQNNLPPPETENNTDFNTETRDEIFDQDHQSVHDEEEEKLDLDIHQQSVHNEEEEDLNLENQNQPSTPPNEEIDLDTDLGSPITYEQNTEEAPIANDDEHNDTPSQNDLSLSGPLDIGE